VKGKDLLFQQSWLDVNRRHSDERREEESQARPAGDSSPAHPKTQKSRVGDPDAAQNDGYVAWPTPIGKMLLNKRTAREKRAALLSKKISAALFIAP